MRCTCPTAVCVINNYWQCATPGCINGPAKVPVAAKPSLADTIAGIAGRWLLQRGTSSRTGDIDFVRNDGHG